MTLENHAGDTLESIEEDIAPQSPKEEEIRVEALYLLDRFGSDEKALMKWLEENDQENSKKLRAILEELEKKPEFYKKFQNGGREETFRSIDKKLNFKPITSHGKAA